MRSKALLPANHTQIEEPTIVGGHKEIIGGESPLSSFHIVGDQRWRHRKSKRANQSRIDDTNHDGNAQLFAAKRIRRFSEIDLYVHTNAAGHATLVSNIDSSKLTVLT